MLGGKLNSIAFRVCGIENDEFVLFTEIWLGGGIFIYKFLTRFLYLKYYLGLYFII
jgi:hypothetical protein